MNPEEGLKFVRRVTRKAYCLELYRLCLLARPETVLDIGTWKGHSCLALASALTVLGQSLKRLTTVDRDHGLWKALLERDPAWLTALKIRDIHVVSADFEALEAGEYLAGRARIFLFYDIHDDGLAHNPSARLLSEWVPQLRDGLVVVHDLSPVAPDWVRPARWTRPPASSLGTHWKGQRFYGFGECARIIGWLNENRAALYPLSGTSLAYFKVEEGRPI